MCTCMESYCSPMLESMYYDIQCLLSRTGGVTLFFTLPAFILMVNLNRNKNVPEGDHFDAILMDV